MDIAEVRALADLVADLVVCRLAGGATGDDERRQDVLLRDLSALSERKGVLPDLLPRVRRVLDDHGFERIAGEIRQLHETEVDPPDDLLLELRRLAEKIRRAQDADTYEYKLPTRVQIRIEDLVSILVEILDILKKLARRSMEDLAEVPREGFGGVALVRGCGRGTSALLLLPDRASVACSGLDAQDRGIAELAFELIGQEDCRRQYRDRSGGRQIRCVASPCAGGCRVLRHPRGEAADPDKVEDVSPSTDGDWVTMNDDFFYWCQCRR